jgi:hypothetical protein
MNAPPHRRATGRRDAREVNARDIAKLWLFLAVAAVVRLVIAFARGEPPLGAFPISEPGFAFLLLVAATPRAARLLTPSSAEGHAGARASHEDDHE